MQQRRDHEEMERCFKLNDRVTRSVWMFVLPVFWGRSGGQIGLFVSFHIWIFPFPVSLVHLSGGGMSMFIIAAVFHVDYILITSASIQILPKLFGSCGRHATQTHKIIVIGGFSLPFDRTTYVLFSLSLISFDLQALQIVLPFFLLLLLLFLPLVAFSYSYLTASECVRESFPYSR